MAASDVGLALGAAAGGVVSLGVALGGLAFGAADAGG
jgi:hypothetical protein